MKTSQKIKIEELKALVQNTKTEIGILEELRNQAQNETETMYQLGRLVELDRIVRKLEEIVK